MAETTGEVSMNGTVYVSVCFSTALSLVGNWGRLTWVNLQQPLEQCYPFLSVCAVFLCIQTMGWLPIFGIFNVCINVSACDCTLGHMYIITESALTVDSGRKITCCTEESNPCQYCARLFGLVLYHLSHPSPAGGERWMTDCSNFPPQFIYGEDGLEVSKTPFLEEKQMPFLLKNQHVIGGLQESVKGDKRIEKHKKKVSTASMDVPEHHVFSCWEE